MRRRDPRSLPSPLRGDIEDAPINHGFRSLRELHPWLHAATPFGVETRISHEQPSEAAGNRYFLYQHREGGTTEIS